MMREGHTLLRAAVIFRLRPYDATDCLRLRRGTPLLTLLPVFQDAIESSISRHLRFLRH